MPSCVAQISREAPVPFDQARQGKKNIGGIWKMCLNKLVVIDDPFESFVLPAGQIYEICAPEGDYKDGLIASIFRRYESSMFIRSENFWDLREYIDHLKTLPQRLGLLIVDIDDVIEAQYARNFEELQDQLGQLCECLEELCQRGITCIVFPNYPHYHEINEYFMPKCGKVRIDPGPISVPDF